jgi:predicted transport protein
MSNLTYIKPERVWLKEHQTFNERWVQQIIADDPAILGLGDLILKDKERIQPRAGRLDLLLQDAETNRRYEVEVQLGKTDESHIIRTIEYWDIERKRYPQYDHCAVIVAEDITSRFLNVVSLFNGFIPLIVVQMNAVKFGEQISLVFTTVLDELPLGLVDEDEEVQEATDRTYWLERRGTKATVSMVDELLEIIKSFDEEVELKYNKFYIGLAKNGQPNNFVIFRPQKNSLRLEPRLQRTDEIEEKLEAAGLDVMDYDKKWSRYRIRLSKGDIKKHAEFLTNLLRSAHENASE